MADQPRPPPPSFSSFPDTTTKPKPPPPSFASFPEPAPPPPRRRDRDSSDSRPAKRPRATEFLDQLQVELHGGSSSKSSRSSTKDSHRSDQHRTSSSRRDSDRDRDDKRTSNSKSSSRKSKDREETKEEREQRKKDKHRSSDGHHKSRSKGKEREREWEREDDYGDRRRKPYQLVQGGDADMDLRPRSPSPVQPDQPTFYSSRKPDNLNVKYGGLNRSDIPRYRRLGAGRVVGLNDGLRITKETAYTNRGVEIAPLRRYRTPRYLDPRSVRHTTDKHFKRIALTARQAPLALGEAPDPSAPPPPFDPFLASSSDPSRFVAFEPERSIEERLADLEYEEGQQYRSIAGLVKPSDLDDPAQGTENDDDVFGGLGIVGGESQDAYIRRRNLEMDRELRDDPTNVVKWLEFVDFQDEVALLSFVGTATKRALSKVERTSTSEIKLSILDRALGIDANRGSETLLLAYLKAAAEVWDPKKVLQRWDETLKSHPHLTGLWIEYVSWRQTSWVNFNVRDIVEVFEEALRVLQGAAEKSDFGSADREILEGNAIYLFLRLCLMLRQAGFSERALAAFQALIELNTFRPVTDARPQPRESEKAWRTRMLADLETFWDSEVPRVGETGAKGWRNSSADDDAPEGSPDTFPTSPLSSDLKPRPHEKWASTERLTSAANPRPARTTDPGIDDDVDPFRVVLFDDVKDFMFIVHSPDSQLQLVYAFLTFLGLPFVPPDFPTSTPFSTDAFIHSELVERPDLIQRFWPKLEVAPRSFELVGGEAMEPERRSALSEPFATPFHTTPVTVDVLFGSKQKWFTMLRQEDLAHVDIELARNSLTILRPTLPDTFLTLDAFAFEACQSPKAAVKLAKQVLRESRQNLALWDGYARIERQRGKVDDSRQVYVTALSMYRTFAPQDQIDGPLLWRAWVEMEWEEGNPMLALKVCVAAAATEEVDLASVTRANLETRPSSAQMLRTRQFYTTQLEASFQPHATQAILRNRNHLAYTAAIFEYISGGLAPAVEVLERHLFRLDCANALGSAEHEEAFMLYVKLLSRHAQAGQGYKPGQLRDVVERAIKEFKNNTLFLSVFYHNELRTKIQNRVRRTLEASVLNKDVTSEGWLFAIFAELHLDARSPSVWGVRNLFDRAIEDPKTRSSASIWTLYIDFEVRNGELARAKSLIYRGVRACPWARELYLRPFSPSLRSVYRSRELRDWSSLMLEKGLRVRVELDSFVDGYQGSDVELAVEDEDEQEETWVQAQAAGEILDAEELLREREYLKPY